MFSKVHVTAESSTDPVAVRFLWRSFTYWSLLPWQGHLVSNNLLVQQSRGVHGDVDVCWSLTSHQLVKGQDLEAEGGQSEAFLTVECHLWMNQSFPLVIVYHIIPLDSGRSRSSWAVHVLQKLRELNTHWVYQWLYSVNTGQTLIQFVWELREQPLNGMWHRTAKIFISHNLGLLVKEYSHEDSGVDN